jgi:hypothetical protein
VPIPADVPKVAKEVQAGVTNAESAVLLERGLITTNDYGIIPVATNLVETRIRAHGFDAITPHGNEQSKFGYRNSNGKFARLLVAHSALEMYLCAGISVSRPHLEQAWTDPVCNDKPRVVVSNKEPPTRQSLTNAPIPRNGLLVVGPGFRSFVGEFNPLLVTACFCHLHANSIVVLVS